VHDRRRRATTRMIHKAPVAAELRGGNDGLLVVTIEFPRFALSAEIQTPNGNFSLGPFGADRENDCLSRCAPRSTKMGNIASLWRYEAAACHAAQSLNLRRPAIFRYASCAAVFQISQGGYPSIGRGACGVAHETNPKLCAGMRLSMRFCFRPARQNASLRAHPWSSSAVSSRPRRKQCPESNPCAMAQASWCLGL
jgi:hypothetical protein